MLSARKRLRIDLTNPARQRGPFTDSRGESPEGDLSYSHPVSWARRRLYSA